MEKWTCKVCGYVHHGEEAPERCPQCGAPQTQFVVKRGDAGCAWAIIILGMTLAGVAVLACRSSLTVDNTAVANVDMKKYLGKWYEIARFDHRFERNMTHCTATYTMKNDGTIKVTNEGKKDGKWKTTNGKARLTDEVGVLRVSFFGPFYSDYRIMKLAPDYSYALVGGGSDDYLWILSRKPQLDEDTRYMLVREAQRRGYQTDKLIWVEQ